MMGYRFMAHSFAAIMRASARRRGERDASGTRGLYGFRCSRGKRAKRRGRVSLAIAANRKMAVKGRALDLGHCQDNEAKARFLPFQRRGGQTISRITDYRILLDLERLCAPGAQWQASTMKTHRGY